MQAFGLLIIYNEHHMWKEQETMKQNRRKDTTAIKRKQCCSGKSRNNQGWPDAGLNLFNFLCHQVDAIRDKAVSIEKQIKEQFIVK